MFDDLKEYKLAELAKFATGKGIFHQPVFVWCVAFTLKKRATIISTVNNKFYKKIHKDGVEMYDDIACTMKFYIANGNTIWKKLCS